MTEQQRIAQREWRRKNPEKLRAQILRYRSAHPERVKQQRHRYYCDNREKYRADGRKYKLGVNNPTGELRIGICPICKRGPMRLSLDHNHKTGKARDHICSGCTIRLIAALESPLLERAQQYLKEWEHPQC